MEAADLTGLDLSGATWKKSSLSGDSGGNCVEVAWKKSSLSGGSGGNCVEVAGNFPEAVAVRDSKNPAGPALVFTPGEWSAFLTTVKSGHFD
ncbi:DUF397 domain-containing protein [Streptosporangium oxazolinicum]|uniref:DUF397 domain-containing protein n=1 Tax=Streptosporangium oxazolinicum TaxID=909287 RepID=A0ABP8AI60_9ACTN